jgi:hypothetical protein
MSEYGEDRANSQVNESILEQEFNLNTADRRQDELDQIRAMRLQLDAIDGEDPDDILYKNIERANTLLDTAQQATERGGETNARLYEVCAQLINAITTAASSIQTGAFGNLKHEYNMKMLEVKEKELVVKQAIAQGKLMGAVPSTGGVVVMSREDLLKMIDEDVKEVQIDSATQNTNEN